MRPLTDLYMLFVDLNTRIDSDCANFWIPPRCRSFWTCQCSTWPCLALMFACEYRMNPCLTLKRAESSISTCDSCQASHCRHGEFWQAGGIVAEGEWERVPDEFVPSVDTPGERGYRLRHVQLVVLSHCCQATDRRQHLWYIALRCTIIAAVCIVHLWTAWIAATACNFVRAWRNALAWIERVLVQHGTEMALNPPIWLVNINTHVSQSKLNPNNGFFRLGDFFSWLVSFVLPLNAHQMDLENAPPRGTGRVAWRPSATGSRGAGTSVLLVGESYVRVGARYFCCFLLGLDTNGFSVLNH